MKRPSFQFYPSDWQSDLKLRRCSPAARGVWMDILCAFHDSDDGYGLLRWPLKDIAATIGASIAHVRELVDKGVLRGSDTHIDEAFLYVPRTGRKDGEPVTLIGIQAGPLWYSKRLVKDEYVRTIRGESSRFSADDGDTPKPARKASPKPPIGDGTSSSSSSSPSGIKPPSGVARHGSRITPDWDPGEPGFAYATTQGMNNRRALEEVEKFRDYWTAESGAKARKLDWQAAWRTWVRNANAFAQKASNHHHSDPFETAR